MSKHYLHHRLSLSKNIHNIRPYRINKNTQQLHAISTSSNRLQLYRVMTDGLALQTTYQFYAEISRIEIMQSDLHDYDYVWVLDRRGRYAIWSPVNGLDYVNNLPTSDIIPQQLEQMLQNTNDQIFSGVTSYSENDNQSGCIFYSTGNRITVLEYSIKKQGCYLSQINTQSFSYESDTIRFIDWITNHNNLMISLGIIVQDEAGNTVLQVHQMCRQKWGRWKLGWSVQKKNLLQFYSCVEREILLLSYDQIALYKYKQGVLASYRTGGNYGQGFYIGDGRYGQVGKQLIVFTKQKLTPFNHYKLPPSNHHQLPAFNHHQLPPFNLHQLPAFNHHQLPAFNHHQQPANDLFQYGGLKQCTYLGHLQGVGAALCLLTTNSQLYYLTINGEECKICRLNEQIPQFLSMRAIAQIKNTFAVVGCVKQDEYSIYLNQQMQSATIVQFQYIDMYVDSLYATVNGSYLIFTSSNSSMVTRLDKNSQYSFYFNLPQGQILAVDNDLLVTQSAIYQVDYQSQQCRILLQSDGIVLAEIVNELVYYLDIAGSMMVYDAIENQVRKVLDSCVGDYCWSSSKSREMLICANLHNMAQLRTIVEKEIKLINIKGHTLISSISTISPNKKRSYTHFNQKLAIGYSDGSIHLQTFEGHIDRVIKLTSNSRIFFTIISASQIMVRCGNRKYHMNCKEESVVMKSVKLAHHITRIDHLVYLQKAQQFLIVVGNRMGNKSMLLRSALTKKNNTSHLTRIEQTFTSQPLMVTLQHYIFYALPSILGKIDLLHNNKIDSCTHQLTHVTALQSSQRGLLMAGQYGCKQMLLICNQQLQVVYKYVCAVNGPINCIRQIQGTNNIMLWNDNTISFHTLQPSTVGLKLLFGSNIGYRGNQCDILPQYQLLILNDISQSISLLNFTDKISQVGGHVSAREVIGCCFLQDDLILWQRNRQVSLFSIERQQLNNDRFIFNKQWNLNLSQQPVTFCKYNGLVCYICQNGTIYCISPLQTEIYHQLKNVQYDHTQSDNNQFNYAQWRSKTKSDRLIDTITLNMRSNDRQQPNRQVQQLLSTSSLRRAFLH